MHVHGRERFLPEQLDGYIRIHHDTDIYDPTRICVQIQPQVQSAQWIHL